MMTASAPGEAAQDMQSGSFAGDMRMIEDAGEISNPIPEPISTRRNFLDGAAVTVASVVVKMECVTHTTAGGRASTGL